MSEWPLTISVAIGVVFYLVIPGSGAFAVRYRWRRFRARVLAAREARDLDYPAVHGHRQENEGDSSQRGTFRFFGKLEAVQGQTSIWIGDGSLSVVIDLVGVPIYILPGGGMRGEGLPDETPRIVFWKELTALAEGTDFLVVGDIVERQGTLHFDRGAADIPLVIIYDCPKEQLFARATWSGRQRNEYWNHLTPVSLVGGFLAETLWALTLADRSLLQAIVAMVLGLVPVLPLMPPGVVGFFWYRRIWRVARRLRAQRDLAFARDESVSAAQLSAHARGLSRRAWHREVGAVVLLVVSIFVNGYLIAIATALLIR